MNDRSNPDLFIEHINNHILPFIDYDRLQESYGTDMKYAKGILNRLHEAAIKIYGNEPLTEESGDDGFVVIPGALRGMESGRICLALLELDLSSSGEHWGTSILCKYGVIAQGGTDVVSDNSSALKSIIKEFSSAYLPYDYCYTAAIPCDIHIDKARLPEELKSILSDFRNHNALLDGEHGDVNAAPDEGLARSSALDKLAAAKDAVARTEAEKPPADRTAGKAPDAEL